MAKSRNIHRKIRHKRIRKRVFGTTQRPRLCVYKSLNNLSAQIIDDSKATVLVSAATFAKSLKSTIGYGGNVKAAEQLGTVLAEKALAKGIKVVVFDRGGCLYHGRIKAFADGIRKGGVVF